MDREKVINGLRSIKTYLASQAIETIDDLAREGFIESQRDIDDAIALMKEQEIEEPHPWEHIWDAPDYTFKGRCRNCGFIQYFIQGHDAQYRFCPQCGEQKVI